MYASHAHRRTGTSSSLAEGKLREYIKRIGASESTLTYSQMRKIFVIAVEDVKKEKLSLEYLSNIAYLLWSKLSNMEKAATDLGDVLFDCYESTCPYCSDRKDSNLTYVFDYYEKHKHFVIEQNCEYGAGKPGFEPE